MTKVRPMLATAQPTKSIQEADAKEVSTSAPGATSTLRRITAAAPFRSM